MQQGSPAWRWSSPAQYDVNMNELLAIWQRYDLLTSGGSLLSALTLPHALISAAGNANLSHSRDVPEGLAISKIHDRCLRLLLNFMYLLVHRGSVQDDPVLLEPGFIAKFCSDPPTTRMAAATTSSSAWPTPVTAPVPHEPLKELADNSNS